jgi:hypothetical protein
MRRELFHMVGRGSNGVVRDKQRRLWTRPPRGVHVDGYVADTAASVDLSEDGRWTPLVKASADALAAAIATVGSGVRVGEIGAAIEKTIEAAGF